MFKNDLRNIKMILCAERVYRMMRMTDRCICMFPGKQRHCGLVNSVNTSHIRCTGVTSFH